MGKIKTLIFEFWGAITQYETSEMLSLQGGSNDFARKTSLNVL